MQEPSSSNNSPSADNDWRVFLSIAPMCAVRLAVAMHGQVTGQPTYLHVPKQEYDGLDFWQATASDTEEGPLIRIYHHKNYSYTEAAQSEKDRHERERGGLIQKIAGCKKALIQEDGGPQAAERQRLLTEWEARSVVLEGLIADAEAVLKTGEETIYPFLLSECV